MPVLTAADSDLQRLADEVLKRLHGHTLSREDVLSKLLEAMWAYLEPYKDRAKCVKHCYTTPAGIVKRHNGDIRQVCCHAGPCLRHWCRPALTLDVQDMACAGREPGPGRHLWHMAG